VIQLALLVPERVVILRCFAAFHAQEIADMPLGVIPVRQFASSMSKLPMVMVSGFELTPPIGFDAGVPSR